MAEALAHRNEGTELTGLAGDNSWGVPLERSESGRPYAGERPLSDRQRALADLPSSPPRLGGAPSSRWEEYSQSHSEAAAIQFRAPPSASPPTHYSPSMPAPPSSSAAYAGVGAGPARSPPRSYSGKALSPQAQADFRAAQEWSPVRAEAVAQFGEPGAGRSAYADDTGRSAYADGRQPSPPFPRSQFSDGPPGFAQYEATSPSSFSPASSDFMRSPRDAAPDRRQASPYAPNGSADRLRGLGYSSPTAGSGGWDNEL
jgi:hypothetical protein